MKGRPGRPAQARSLSHIIYIYIDTYIYAT